MRAWLSRRHATSCLRFSEQVVCGSRQRIVEGVFVTAIFFLKKKIAPFPNASLLFHNASSSGKLVPRPFCLRAQRELLDLTDSRANDGGSMIF
jgi:hypothetical protein